MKGKKIANIVFYKYFDSRENNKQACIFYADGSVRNVSFDEGIDACEEIVRDLNIHTKDAFKEMINHDIVHVMSSKDFEERFNSFIPSIRSFEGMNNDDIEESKDITPVSSSEEEKHEIVEPVESHDENEEIDPVLMERLGHVDTDEHDDLDGDMNEETTSESGDLDDEDILEEDTTNNRIVPIPVPVPTDEDEEELVEINDSDDTSDSTNDSENEEENEEDKSLDPDAEVVDVDVEDAEFLEDHSKEEKKGFFQRLREKLRKNRVITKIVAVVTALAIGLGLYSAAKRLSKDGFMARSNLTSVTETDNRNPDKGDQTLVLIGENSLYNDYSFNQLLNVTENATQKTAMTNLGQSIYGFNDIFASKYLENGKNIRAALKFDEIVALQMAYNDYSKDQIKAYFNGSEIRANDLSRSYKDATLQLMGAHVLETKENPVDMSALIESQEGKDFYKKYHEMFLAAKEAKGDEKLRLVTAFYTQLRKDFPVTHEVRTEGISHSENYESLEAYKLSVTPMVAAAEMLWQNLAKDVTLNDEEIDFFNDIGLCNYADATFERIETITLSSDTDSKNPLYSQYRTAMINAMRDKGIYYVDDEHRELSNLDAFKNAVNWHFNEVEGEKATGSGYTAPVTSAPVTTTRTETETHTETETTYHTETEVINLPITPEAKAEVDEQLARENEEARIKAEQEAEKERQRLQEEADKEAARVEEEVRQDEEDLQDDIEEANDQIDDNNSDNNPNNDDPVNEDDFGDHDVDFDDDHSDDQGNLDPSVQDITTDPTGDRTNDPLPDPNQTGADFDRRGEESHGDPELSGNSYYDQSNSDYGYRSTGSDTNYNSGSNNNSNSSSGFYEEEVPLHETFGDGAWVDTVPVSDDYYYENAWIEYGDGTNEDIVNSYVDYMSSDNYGGNLESESYEYTR